MREPDSSRLEIPEPFLANQENGLELVDNSTDSDDREYRAHTHESLVESKLEWDGDDEDLFGGAE